MVEEAADLAIEHADELAAARHVDAEQLLDRQAEGMLLVHRRDIVEPVEIRHRLQIGLVLDQLLGAAMQQADMRIDAVDDLAVELEHEAQHAVRRRMLRPEIDGEVADLGRGTARPMCVGNGDGVGQAAVSICGSPRRSAALDADQRSQDGRRFSMLTPTARLRRSSAAPSATGVP